MLFTFEVCFLCACHFSYAFHSSCTFHFSGAFPVLFTFQVHFSCVFTFEVCFSCDFYFSVAFHVLFTFHVLFIDAPYTYSCTIYTHMHYMHHQKHVGIDIHTCTTCIHVHHMHHQLQVHIYVTDRGLSAPACGLWDLGELRLPPKGAVLSLTLLLVRCLR